MINYVESEQFSLPADATLFETLIDGRLLAIGPSRLWVEDAPGGHAFSEVESPEFGFPSFARVSPAGTRVAVGNFQANTISSFEFPFSSGMDVDQVTASSFDAEWLDDARLIVSNQGGDGTSPPSVLSVVDVNAGSVQDLIVGIDGFSAGATIDSDRNIYTGNGFAPGDPPRTGRIKAFRREDWEPAVAAGGTLDFQSQGKIVANLISAAALGFDVDGNLHVGGGNGTAPDGGPDRGYAAVISKNALRQALHDGPVIQPDFAGNQLQRLDPDPCVENNFWFVNSNSVTRALYLKDFSQSLVRVYHQDIVQNLTDTNLHLGDSPHAFPGSTFVGMSVSVPVPLPALSDFQGPICLRLETREIQTLGVSRHAVFLNDVEIGRMTDGSFQDDQETFDFIISREKYATIIAGGASGKLRIDVDAAAGPGFADDFVLRRFGPVYVPA